MASFPFLENSHCSAKCPQCDEELFFPEWSEPTNAGELCHLWRCLKCGVKFETRDEMQKIQNETEVKNEIMEKYFPSLLLT